MRTTTRDFSFSVRTTLGFPETLDILRQKLQREGFRVVSEVHFHREFEKTVGLSWRKYTVLVVWNSFHAYQALISDQDGGLFVPFHLVVAEDSRNTLIATKNHGLNGSLAEIPIGIQVLVRELNRKMRQIFLELARHEVVPEDATAKYSPREAR